MEQKSKNQQNAKSTTKLRQRQINSNGLPQATSDSSLSRKTSDGTPPIFSSSSSSSSSSPSSASNSQPQNSESITINNNSISSEEKNVNQTLSQSWQSKSLHMIPLAYAEIKKSAHEIIEQIWKLQLHVDLPGWRRDNDYLVANHRPVLASITQCAASIFKFHSETFNIWTHLLGLILLVFYCHFITHASAGQSLPSHELAILNLHSLMGALCFLFSTTFHVLECHSPFIHEMFCRLDHFGIAGLIWASKLAWIKSSSLDRDDTINSALIQGANLVSLTSVILQFSGFLARPSQQTFRTIWFISTSGVFVLFPLVDVLQKHGLEVAVQIARIDLFLLSILSILVGCIFYVCHVPERFFPGQCDIFLQGHTLLHIFVNFTIFLQVYGFRESAVNRANWKLTRQSSFWG